jgi:hypothetical protein
MPSKTKGESTSRPNRIRFIMLDADLSDGNLTELTQAITSALRPQLPQRIAPPPSIGQLAAGNGHTAVEEAEVAEAEVLETPAAEVPAPAATPRVRPQYDPPTPNYLPDLDPDMAFKEYAAARPQSMQTKRYLLAAVWLRDHKQLQNVGMDHVYTCYRNAGWPLKIRDWDSNFRSLVRQKWMRRIAPGEYAVNPIGEAELQTK